MEVWRYAPTHIRRTQAVRLLDAKAKMREIGEQAVAPAYVFTQIALESWTYARKPAYLVQSPGGHLPPSPKSTP